MNRRSLFAIVAVAVATLTGCSLASDTQDTSQEHTGTTASALQRNDENENENENGDDNGNGSLKVFTLSLSANGAIVGVNAAGRTFIATFNSATTYRAANLNQFIPVDPLRPSLVAYNAALGFPELLRGAIAQLAAVHANARVQLVSGTNVVRSFQPVRGTTTN